MSDESGDFKTVRGTKTIGILQPSYLPWLGYFEQIHRSHVFVLYDDVQFEKGSWRNRNRIKKPDGALWLTVPVLLKGRGFPLIRDVKINRSVQWQKKHIRGITQSYLKAPFFERYADDLFKIMGRPWKFLIDLNLELTYWSAEQLGISTPLILASELGVPGSRVQRLIDIIHSLGGNHFYEGAAGRDYIDVPSFEKAGISVTFQDYEHPRYPQLHGDFVPYLSIVDLLFNCGLDSLNTLAIPERKKL